MFDNLLLHIKLIFTPITPHINLTLQNTIVYATAF